MFLVSYIILPNTDEASAHDMILASLFVYFMSSSTAEELAS